MFRLEALDHRRQPIVVRLNPCGELCCRIRALVNEQGTPIGGRNIKKQKLAPAILIDFLDEALILSHELWNKDTGLVLPECIPDTSLSVSPEIQE